MKFDTVIIGGGLSGLAAGVELACARQRVAIVSSGQSCMHFISGSLELTGYGPDGRHVANPMDAVASMPPQHPYTLMGRDLVGQHAERVATLFDEAGIKTKGSHLRNHWRISPVGVLKPAWLTLEDYATVDNAAKMPWKDVCIVNLRGFLDFFPDFLAAGLERLGVDCRIKTVSAPAIECRRESTTGMRATNIARVLHGTTVDELAAEINRVAGGVDMVLFPAVAGFNNFRASRRLKEEVSRPMRYIATMGTSVPGVRAQIMLERHFSALGGTFMLGDTVVRGIFSGSRLRAVETINFKEDLLEADNFIFAAGSFFSHGLTATPEKVLEPVLGLDVCAPGGRQVWFDKDLFARQPYMSFGIAISGDTFRAMRQGATLDNVFVAGSALAGCDPIREGSGAGIATTTALHVASKILNS